MPLIGHFFWYVALDTAEPSPPEEGGLRYYRVQDTGWVNWMPVVADTAPRPTRRRRRDSSFA